MESKNGNEVYLGAALNCRETGELNRPVSGKSYSLRISGTYHTLASVCSVLLLLSLAVSLSSLVAAQDRLLNDELEAGFLQPPHEAKPSAYWLWLNGYANRDYFEKELQEFADKGVGGLCIFDMGVRGDPDFFPPTGPAFMSDAFVESIASALQAARRNGMDVQLAACSSWDLGGSWVKPEHASMALYRSEIRTEGPTQLDVSFPFPTLPAEVSLEEDGMPAFHREVVVLAIPETRRLPGHEFIFRLPRGEKHRIDHVVLYNASTNDPGHYGELQLFSKDFSVAISTTDFKRLAFQEVVTGSLAPNTEAQRFEFAETDARYVRLTIYNGHNPRFEEVQLAEFEIVSTEGVNIGGSKSIDRSRDMAELVRISSESAVDGKWTAENLHDGVKSGPAGIWSFAGPPPLVIPDRSRILELSNHLDEDGHFQWDVPEGKWTIMRFVCANTGERLKVPSPNSDGLATDHFNAEATRTFIQTLIDRLENRLGDLPKAGIKQLYLPSYEVVGAKWTPDFLEQFEHYRNYDMTQYLPVFAGCLVDSEERTARFLYDFEKTLGDLLVDAYYRTASETARRAGLGIEAEAGGPGPPTHNVPVDALKALGSIDEMRGEFWPWRMERSGLWVVKETASAAHVYGRRRVHMEAFTGFRHWQDGPFDLKPSADRAFCEGMNHVVWHTASHQPPEAGKPGWVYGAGTHLTPNLVWWPMAKPFLHYLSRCSYLLQQGLFVGDVCYYYGDQGSNFVPPKHVDPSLGYGYDYDVVNPEVILNRMTVRDGKITLPDGMQYELLVLPQRQDFDLEVLRKIEQLVQSGATVVGPKPGQSNGLTDYPARDQQVKELADQLWGKCDGQSVFENQYGKGKVIWGRSLREILQGRGIGPDFEFSDEGNDHQLDYIHRQTADADIYFVRNTQPSPASVTATFRVSGKVPEIWFPESGDMLELAVYQETRQGMRVPLTLDPFGSVFVIFRKPVASIHFESVAPNLIAERISRDAVRFTALQGGHQDLRTSDHRAMELVIDPLPVPLEVEGPWKVSFPLDWGVPHSIRMAKLVSWTEHDHEGIRHFSGSATYETTLEVPPSWLGTGKKVHLDLGHLYAVGRVRLNGEWLGTLWKPPYRVDVTKAVVPGQNQLEVEVANTWANRLVGDSYLSPDKRFSQTNITRSGTPSKPWSEIPLRESGLLGPVQLIPAVEKTLTIAPSE